jgi:hypothetical protein
MILMSSIELLLPEQKKEKNITCKNWRPKTIPQKPRKPCAILIEMMPHSPLPQQQHCQQNRRPKCIHITTNQTLDMMPLSRMHFVSNTAIFWRY